MARRGADDPPELTQAEINKLRAETGLTQAQIQALATEARQKEAGLQIERGKLDLGGRQLTSEEQRAKIAGAVDLLRQQAQERTAGVTEQGRLASDVMSQQGIPDDIRARTLAAMGHPEMYNALATERATKVAKAVQTYVPELKKPMDETKRRAKFGPVLDAIQPGLYDKALALAYPQEGRPAPTFEPELYRGPTTAAPAATDQTGALLNRLLAESRPAPAPVTYRKSYNVSGLGQQNLAQFMAFNDLSDQPLPPVRRNVEGGQINPAFAAERGIPAGYDFNFNTGEYVPQSRVGMINGRPAIELNAENALRRGVSPEDTRTREAYNLLAAQQPKPMLPVGETGRPDIGQPVGPVGRPIPQPAGMTDLVPPPMLLGQTLEKPTPVATEGPAPTPAIPTNLNTSAVPFLGQTLGNLVDRAMTPGPPPWVDLAEIERQKKLREALAQNR